MKLGIFVTTIFAKKGTVELLDPIVSTRDFPRPDLGPNKGPFPIQK